MNEFNSIIHLNNKMKYERLLQVSKKKKEVEQRNENKHKNERGRNSFNQLQYITIYKIDGLINIKNSSQSSTNLELRVILRLIKFGVRMDIFNNFIFIYFQ